MPVHARIERQVCKNQLRLSAHPIFPTPLPIALPLSNLFYCAQGRGIAAHAAPQFFGNGQEWARSRSAQVSGVHLPRMAARIAAIRRIFGLKARGSQMMPLEGASLRQ